MKQELNFANRQRNARTGIIRNLERLHPGMIVCSEAFDIESSDPVVCNRERSLCLKMKAGFVKDGIGCQVVLTKVGAYVLRSKKGLKTNLTHHKESIQSVAFPHSHLCNAKKGASRA
jgi:hypothetical protein